MKRMLWNASLCTAAVVSLGAICLFGFRFLMTDFLDKNRLDFYVVRKTDYYHYPEEVWTVSDLNKDNDSC